MRASEMSESEAKRQHGVVTKWFDERYFGFIAPDSGGRDIFLHKRQCNFPVKEGDRVSFDVAPSPGHPGKFQAANVERLP